MTIVTFWVEFKANRSQLWLNGNEYPQSSNMSKPNTAVLDKCRLKIPNFGACCVHNMKIEANCVYKKEKQVSTQFYNQAIIGFVLRNETL